MASYSEANKYFVTAKTDTPLLHLLEKHLPKRHNPAVVIQSGGVWRNKKRIFNPEFIIRSQETIKVHTSSFQGKSYLLEPENIIFENPDFMVVYKPVDLNVHSVPSSIYYNLAYAVNQYLEKNGIDFESTPVTRLDRPVEGLVIFPKKKQSERLLFRLIKERRIKKWYMAALEHNTDPAIPHRKRIKDHISNNGVRTIPDEGGKFADSLFIKKTRKSDTPASIDTPPPVDFYSIFIFTGRRHQIRFHASRYIAPIAGDWLYGAKSRLKPDEIALMCRGYNIPYRRQNLKIRIPQRFIQQFYEKLQHLKLPNTH
jgi:23S rRNA-/tRNA-specific pseudouridylate synthase